ncbi:hypothetical protein DPMN_040871 [Dreissena polymorpha]|uniref:Uncharacterized protein n=1 Tax=Dreissena polymorpha TaxID=45954 RepID=A0A9D4CVU3_DREPO|nr:hypothetical protein DPMN_040871 [Dreissena polymorpha]
MLVLCVTSCSKPQYTESSHFAVDLYMSSVIPLVQSPSPQRVLTLLLTYACPLCNLLFKAPVHRECSLCCLSMHVLCVTFCSKPQSTESAHLVVDLYMSSVLPLVQSPSPQKVLTLLLIYACPL